MDAFPEILDPIGDGWLKEGEELVISRGESFPAPRWQGWKVYLAIFEFLFFDEYF